MFPLASADSYNRADEKHEARNCGALTPRPHPVTIHTTRRPPRPTKGFKPMRRLHGPFHILLATALLAAPAAQAQAPRLEIVNLRQEVSGRIWGSGNWMAYAIDEDEKSLNGDMDFEDTLLCLVDLRTMATRNTGLAINYKLADSDDDWAAAFSPTQVAVRVSEVDQGGRDLNGDGRTQDDVLCLFNPTTRQLTSLRVSGSRPTFIGENLYFVQPEGAGRKDLNGDGDTSDAVVCVYDAATKKVESLQMEAEAGFSAAGDWLAAVASEAAQGGRDLNGDGDTSDAVAQVYQLSQKRWTNTGLEAAGGYALTPRLLAVSSDERKQGGKDLNGDGDATDDVCQVWNLATGKAANTGQQVVTLAAEGALVAFTTAETSQGRRDLNRDGDADDDIVQVYTLGAARPLVSLARDGSGGVVVSGGKVAFACSEDSQAHRDLNADKDADDTVAQVYDPVRNAVFNTAVAVDGDLRAGEGFLAWKCAESQQGERDLNRDGDTDEAILYVLNLATNAVSSTGMAAGEYTCVTARGVGFATLESDQGNRDLNADRDTDDEVLQIARFGAR